MTNKEFPQTLHKYKEEGKLYSQVHPTLPLTIWNYTLEVQYEGLWDDITLMCRGLVTDDQGNIVARPFKKFFNIEENKHTPTDDFEVFEKLDGSLIIVFWYAGEMVVASRGSFTSDHVGWATEIIKEKYLSFKDNISTKLTYCFELIHPENRIVVDYGDQKDLILTAINYTDSGEYNGRWWPGLQPVKVYTGLDWKNIKNFNWKNSEGFVVRFSNGDRCKIKFEDYIRLHRIMTNISEKRIWKALSEGQPITSILENVPDEFFEEVHGIEQDFLNKYDGIESDSEVVAYYYKKSNMSRKEIAEEVLRRRKNTASIIFAMLDEKDYSQIIWKMLKP